MFYALINRKCSLENENSLFFKGKLREWVGNENKLKNFL